MSLKGKYTTVRNVIERVRRSGISDFTEEEAKEWTWEVISLMGIPAFYVDRVANIPIENARGTLPYDLFDLSEGGVREYYTKIPLLEEKNIYYDNERVGEQNLSSNLEFEYPSIFYVDGVPVDNGDVFLTAAPNNFYERQEYTYKINGGFLYTGFKEGVVQMSYKAFPVDNDNSPLITDDYRVIRTVELYITVRCLKRMWLRDEISAGKLQKFEQEYSWAMSSVISDNNLGSIDDWEAIRSRTQRIYRDPNLHRTGFRGYSYREGMDIHDPSLRNNYYR